jgi:hypothetical protein
VEEVARCSRVRRIRGKGMCFQVKISSKRLVRSLSANSGSAGCFDTTIVPHDFLDPTGTPFGNRTSANQSTGVRTFSSSRSAASL